MKRKVLYPRATIRVMVDCNKHTLRLLDNSRFGRTHNTRPEAIRSMIQWVAEYEAAERAGKPIHPAGKP